ncbi:MULTISPECIES: hypothetical protein [Bacteroides]|jgi:hypothetical protein|nr:MULTISPECIES: hypothetical protein [Bacteroides]NVK92924.1 hypothetical protein [Bacteroides sp. L10-4]
MIVHVVKGHIGFVLQEVIQAMVVWSGRVDLYLFEIGVWGCFDIEVAWIVVPVD